MQKIYGRTMAMKCFACGKEVHEGSKFCYACGTNLTATPAPAVEAAPQAPAQSQYEFTPTAPQQPVSQATQYQPQPGLPNQPPVVQPWNQMPNQAPAAQPWMPPQGQPGVQYVYTYGQPATPGGPQIVYVKTKTPGRGFGISSMVLGIIGLVYTFSGISSLNQIELMYEEMVEMGQEYIQSTYLGTLIVISVMPLLALIFGCCARKKGYKNGVSMSGLIMGIIGLVLILIEVLVLIGKGAL